MNGGGLNTKLTAESLITRRELLHASGTTSGIAIRSPEPTPAKHESIFRFHQYSAQKWVPTAAIHSRSRTARLTTARLSMGLRIPVPQSEHERRRQHNYCVQDDCRSVSSRARWLPESGTALQTQ